MNDISGRIYLCRNKEEWRKLMQFLDRDKRHKWVGGDPLFHSRGEMTIGYNKDFIEAIFVDKSYRLTHSELWWALQEAGGMSYTLHWVHKEAFFIGSSFLLKPNLPHL